MAASLYGANSCDNYHNDNKYQGKDYRLDFFLLNYSHIFNEANICQGLYLDSLLKRSKNRIIICQKLKSANLNNLDIYKFANEVISEL